MDKTLLFKLLPEYGIKRDQFFNFLEKDALSDDEGICERPCTPMQVPVLH